MKQHNKVLSMCIAAMLSAIGIVIPIFAPKIVLEPASFTLASHVPIFIAMFISPWIAVFVALTTTFGFFISGLFPMVVVIRAFSHLLFATVGALILKKNGNILMNPKSTALFAFAISVLHAAAEVVVVTFYYFGPGLPKYEAKGYLFSVVLLVGIGGLIHSIIDFAIAILVWKPLQHLVSIPTSARVRTR